MNTQYQDEIWNSARIIMLPSGNIAVLSNIDWLDNRGEDVLIKVSISSLIVGNNYATITACIWAVASGGVYSNGRSLSVA